MRIITVIGNLGWNLPKFCKQIGCLVLGLAGLCALSIATLLFYSFYFNFNQSLEGWPAEEPAVARALAVADDAKPCRGPNKYLSRDNRACYLPQPTDRRHCRWWILEECRSFTMPDFILSDPVKLGTMIDVMIHPLRRGPIVIEFIGGTKTVIIRID